VACSHENIMINSPLHIVVVLYQSILSRADFGEKNCIRLTGSIPVYYHAYAVELHHNLLFLYTTKKPQQLTCDSQAAHE